MRKVNLNIYLFELLSNVSKYAKFLKGMLADKKKYKEEGVVTLSSSCSCIIKRDIQIPKMQKNPGSHTILCEIGNKHFARTLAI